MYNLLDFDSTQFFRCVNLILFTVKSRSVLTSDFGNSQVCSVETLFAHLFTRQIGTVQYSKDKSECHREEASSSLRAIRVRIPEKKQNCLFRHGLFLCICYNGIFNNIQNSRCKVEFYETECIEKLFVVICLRNCEWI